MAERHRQKEEEAERGGEREREEVNSASERSNPLRPKGSSCSHRQDDKEVGTPSARSNLCTTLTAVSTAGRSKIHEDSVREATVEEQLCSQTNHPAMPDSPAPAPSPSS